MQLYTKLKQLKKHYKFCTSPSTLSTPCNMTSKSHSDISHETSLPDISNKIRTSTLKRTPQSFTITNRPNFYTQEVQLTPIKPPRAVSDQRRVSLERVMRHHNKARKHRVIKKRVAANTSSLSPVREEVRCENGAECVLCALGRPEIRKGHKRSIVMPDFSKSDL